MSNKVIIYKRRKGGHHDDDHGGAWKIAFADFMTAMMALFLLLWLVSITTQEQREGIAMFFNPLAFDETKSASNGMFSGQEVDIDGVDQSKFENGEMEMPSSATIYNEHEVTVPGEVPTVESLVDEAMQAELVQQEAERAALEAIQDAEFSEMAGRIREKMSETDLGALTENLLLQITEDGLRIQLTDMEKSAMFPVGSTDMAPVARSILEIVGETIRDVPNGIAITGHTDGRAYRSSAGFDNWDLSSGRANSARRILLSSGVDVDRLKRVEGLADREHLVEDDDNDPRNRRISVLLLRGT